MKRIGVLKGVFDPITLVDRQIALQLLHTEQLSMVVFQVAQEGSISLKDRIALLQRTIAPYRRLAIWDGKKQPGYLYDEYHDPRLDQGFIVPDFTCLNFAAATYAIQRALYFDTLAKRILSIKRYHHVHCMALLSAELAERYGLTRSMGLVAGCLHDITKEWDKEQQQRYTTLYRPEMLVYSPKIYHQYTAELIARTKFQITDRKILDAVGNHVNGTDRKILSKIIYCADKIDDSREYDNTAIKALCFRDINQGYQQVKAEQMAYLKEKKSE